MKTWNWLHKSANPQRNDPKATFLAVFSSLGHFFRVSYARNWLKITNSTSRACLGGDKSLKMPLLVYERHENSYLTPRAAPGQSKMTQKSPRPDTFLPTWHNNSLIWIVLSVCWLWSWLVCSYKWVIVSCRQESVWSRWFLGHFWLPRSHPWSLVGVDITFSCLSYTNMGILSNIYTPRNA